MRLQTKLLTAFGGVLAAALMLSSFLDKRLVADHYQRELQNEAQIITGSLKAMSAVYQREFINKGLLGNDKTLSLLPAHTMAQVSQEFLRYIDTGLVFKNASDVVRNPYNQADAIETQAIEHFRAHTEDTELMLPFTDGGKKYFLYAEPLRIEPYCLNCHGKPEQAPNSIRNTYTTAFDYKIGELRGILSIKLPVAALEERNKERNAGRIWRTLALLAALFIPLFWLIRKLVVRRIEVLQKQMQRLGDGDLSVRARITSNDELGRLAGVFNTMADKLDTSQQRMRQLSTAIEQSPVSVIITDPNGHIQYANPKFSEVTGYSLDEVAGNNPRILKSGHTSSQDYSQLWQTIKSGRTWYGEFLNRHKDGSHFWEHASISPVFNPEGEIEHFIAVKEDVTVRKEYEKRLQQQENYDSLTGLPNRNLGIDRISQAISQSRLVAIAALDLDHFQKINDSQGHAGGDALLKQVASRLKGALQQGDTLARSSADEFLIVLCNRSESQIQLALNDLHTALAEPFQINQHSVFITASIGVTLFPTDSNETHILLRNADAALHQAQHQGRNRTCYFHPQINERAVALFNKETELRRALERNEFSLHYQPQICAQSGRVVAAEALLRWDNHTLGRVPPDRFIPLAEQTGLIVPIGHWVLETACRDAAHWPLPLRVAVNVSARQLADDSFYTSLSHALDSSGLPAGRLEVEITESLLQQDMQRTSDILDQLTRLGVQVVLDDFGTGYSSLSYLSRFPFRTLKLDRSFIQNINTNQRDAALCNAIIHMAKVLELQVVAEGVETVEQLHQLGRWGVDLIQGYYYSPPMPADAFFEFLGRTHK